MTGTDRRVPRLSDDEWETCRADERCIGLARVETGACLHHADEQAVAAALEAMYLQRHYDLRGTTLSGETVRRILTEPYRAGSKNVVNPHGMDLAAFDEVRYDLRHCTITGPVTLSDIRVLRGYVDLSDATFDQAADFSRARFLARVVCERTQFSRGGTFTETRFESSAWFVSTVFLASSDFTDATFGDTVSFHSAEVSGTLAFPGAVFTAGADFNRVRGHQFDLPDKRGLLDLSDTVFEQRAHADLGTDFACDGARFEAGLDLRLSGGRRASLRGVRFGAASTFSGVHRVDLDAELTAGRDTERPVPRPGAAWNVLQPRTRFRPPQLLSLQDTDVEKLSLADVDLGHCLFAGAHNLDKLRLDGPIRFAALPPRGFRTSWNWPVVWRWSRREVIREEYLWRMGRLDPADETFQYWAQQFELAHAGPRASPARRIELITGERLAALYRSLRKAREDAKDEPGAGDFYYGEQEARRGAHSTRPHERWLLTAYWALSGYGQRASRALAALVILLATLTVLLTGFGLADTGPIQRMTGTLQPAPPGPPQVITFDVVGQRVTATIPPATPGTQSVELDVTASKPTTPRSGQKWTADRAERAVRTLATSLVPIATDQRVTATGAYLVLTGRVLGVFLFGLAVLAIRARVKR